MTPGSFIRSLVITYKSADVPLQKSIYVVGAVPKTGGFDYYFLSSGTWTLVGSDLAAATWLTFVNSQNVTSNNLDVFSGFDISAYPAGTTVYAGISFFRDQRRLLCSSDRLYGLHFSLSDG